MSQPDDLSETLGPKRLKRQVESDMLMTTPQSPSEPTQAQIDNPVFCTCGFNTPLVSNMDKHMASEHPVDIDDSPSDIRAKAHEAMDKYLDAGGSPDLYILSQKDADNIANAQPNHALDISLDTSELQILEILRHHHHLPTEQDIDEHYKGVTTDVLDSASACRAIKALLNTQLTAEREAIKAALPEKRDLTDPERNHYYEKYENIGYNQALTEVTQVIDGREG
jgi:hypothetical protein